VKQIHPDTPLILYINGSGSLLERVRQTGIDLMSLDWMVDMADARNRLGSLPVQGNLEPMVLLGSPELIRQRTLEVIRKAGPTVFAPKSASAPLSSSGRRSRTRPRWKEKAAQG